MCNGLIECAKVWCRKKENRKRKSKNNDVVYGVELLLGAHHVIMAKYPPE